MTRHRIEESQRFHARLDASPVAVSGSRADFEAWLAQTTAAEDVIHELLIVYSELVANAVEAAPGTSEQIEASAWLQDGSIVLRVENPVTPTSTSVSSPDLDDPLRTGGRGLLIIRAYTDVLRTELSDGTLAIRCERRISG